MNSLNELYLPVLKSFCLFVCFQKINLKLDFNIPIWFWLLNTPFYFELFIHFLLPFLISISYPFSIWNIIFYWTSLVSTISLMVDRDLKYNFFWCFLITHRSLVKFTSWFLISIFCSYKNWESLKGKCAFFVQIKIW